MPSDQPYPYALFRGLKWLKDGSKYSFDDKANSSKILTRENDSRELSVTAELRSTRSLLNVVFGETGLNGSTSS